MRVNLLFAVFLLLAAGCGDNNLPKLSFTENLRILAIKSNPVTVRAGTTVATITALVSDPKGAGRNITYTWKACLLTQLDASGTGCAQHITTSTQTTTSATPVFNFTNGFSSAAPVLITLTAVAGNETRSANRNLPVIDSTATQTTPPVISSITIDGSAATSAITLVSGRSYRLEANISGVTALPYFITWITDGGTLDSGRTSENYVNNYTTKNVSGTYNLYAVLNDGSGGVDFVTRQVIIP